METMNIEAFSTELTSLVEARRSWVVLVGGDEVTPRTGLRLTDGTILTVALEAQVGDKVSFLTDVDQAPQIAEVLTYDTATGLAVLRSEATGTGWDRESGTEARLGQLAITVAYPSPQGFESRLGMVRCLGADGSYFQTDSPAFPGFAGAPIFSTSGALIGLTMLGGGGNASTNLPVAKINAIIDGKDTAPARRARLGVSTRAVPVAAGVSGDEERTALFVEAVAEGSAAETAGVRYGDILLEIDDSTLDSPRRLHRVLASKKAGEEVSITLLRAAERVVVKATLGEWERSHHHGGGHWHHWTARTMSG